MIQSLACVVVTETVDETVADITVVVAKPSRGFEVFTPLNDMNVKAAVLDALNVVVALNVPWLGFTRYHTSTREREEPATTAEVIACPLYEIAVVVTTPVDPPFSC
jgi:hypothetical protein